MPKLSNSKPRILFIMLMPPPIHGAAMVGKYIHDSKLVKTSFNCHFENMMLASSLEDIGKGRIKKILNLAFQLKRFKQAIKEFQPNIVYITPNAAGGAFYKDFIIVQYIKHCIKKYIKDNNSKIAIHYHNKGVSKKQNKILDNILYKKFFKGLKVILLANALYKDVEKYVTKENIFICPNGIPETFSQEPTIERHNKIPKILFLSNLIISKGVLVLLDSLKILKDHSIPFCCDIVGGETAELNAMKLAKEINKRGLHQAVHYAGCKYGKEKQEVLKNTDIFTFPTFYCNEAFPLVILEAMEYKLPVISTNEGGITEMIENGVNGLICERQNAQSLAEALKKLLLNKNLRIQYGENGYKKFKLKYTLHSFELNLVSVLKDILSQSHK